ncbi:glutamate racemase [Helicobacter sp. MIT 14-3879]|uniref:glutamate racemase n=1 Tax=Helicobacter sp. MIT 14-3879 TaxID=2040649 RepID=UPI000E1EECD9|nr:glutamate racemase [Helicobacter sp. MIT 14-3879]RDU63986.1 glutamate racemase [Helicobacter sp. MIT 14-3879]
MKIGVFDSGIGGLSVLKSLLNSNLFSEIIYYGDTARVPYGNKDKDTIIRFSLEAIDFFNKFDIDMLVVACNTVSAYGLVKMQEIASYDIVGVIEPGVILAKNNIANLDSSILIIATKATIDSNLYASKLNKLGYKNIISIQTGLFVPLVEEGIFSGELLECAFKYYFKDIEIPDAIILGCTHFPLIQNEIKHYFNNKPILIHSGEAIVRYLFDKYKLNQNNKSTTKVSYYVSGSKEILDSCVKIWLNS